MKKLHFWQINACVPGARAAADEVPVGAARARGSSFDQRRKVRRGRGPDAAFWDPSERGLSDARELSTGSGKISFEKFADEK